MEEASSRASLICDFTKFYKLDFLNSSQENNIELSMTKVKMTARLVHKIGAVTR